MGSVHWLGALETTADEATAMRKTIPIAVVRRAIANYMYSEGCDCCSDREKHPLHRAALGKLLNVPMFSDKSGYNFDKFAKK